MELSVKNMSFRYPGASMEALKGISFEVGGGEIFGFLGPSGAGKSTAQKIMIGLLRGYAGEYSIDGRSAARWGRELFEHIGVVFEQPNLYCKFTGRENLDYFASFYRGECLDPAEVLHRLGLEEAGDLRVENYSKGMRTRLNLARALMHRPELLFLDEPTSGLDPANARMVAELIREERRSGQTVFLTTHNMQVADDLCDRLGFLADGELVRVDAPRTLKITFGERKLYLEYRRSDGQSDMESFPLDGIGDNQEFLTLLKSLGPGEIERIRSGEASLEDVFLKVTGKELL